MAEIRILTLNIHKGFCIRNRRFVLDGLRDAIRETEADLVCLQEVMGEGARRVCDLSRAAARTSQYEYLADSIWSSHAYGCNAIYPGGHHGNAILSRYPITAWDNLDISVGSKDEKRGLLHCQIDVEGQRCHVVCVHLGLKEIQRQLQLDQLNHFLTTLPPGQPVLVAGDFNDWRQKAPLKTPLHQLKEVFLHGFGHFMKTFPARFPVLRLDRIYVRNVKDHKPRLLPKEPWVKLSDHLPLCAEVEL